MDNPRTIAVTGASGLVGSALVESLRADGVRVLELVRRAARSDDEVAWDPSEGEIDARPLEGIDAVVHLAGKNIAKEKWTDEVKRQIVSSRIDGTRLISNAIAGLQTKPRVLLSASAIGYYGDRPGEVIDEQSPPGEGFLPETCQQWEAACQSAWEAGVRVAQLRIGVVLDTEGGILKSLLPMFRWGLGGVVSPGDQMFSWIALHDLVRAIRFILDNDSMHGAVNGTAPNPVTNREFTKALGAELNRPTPFFLPKFPLRAAKGEMADALMIEGADIRPQRLLEAGFQFETPELGPALARVLG